MDVCLCHVEVVYAIDFSSLISSPYERRKVVGEKAYHVMDSLFMANMMVQVATLYCIAFVSYSRFCKHL